MNDMASGKSTKSITDNRGTRCYQETKGEKKARKRHRKENLKTIAEIEMMARKEGLSYGQYVSKYGL